MTRYLTVDQVRELHALVLAETGGRPGIRDEAALESAVAQPQATFGGKDLYPTLVEKAACLAYSLVKNHAFVDGNKRIGHAAMETFLLLNGYEIDASVDDQEAMILALAAGALTREELAQFIHGVMVPYSDES